jgi:pimeloyl-ACP methyl ester carboxylesterase
VTSQVFRRRWGAVLAFSVLGAAACGDGSGDPSGVEPPTDTGQAPTPGCHDGVLEHGALYRVCFPQTWNGDVVLYAHGYVSPGNPLSIPDDAVAGQSVSGTITGLGYAYAATSYRANGLVGPEAVEDLVELEATVRDLYRPDPVRTLIAGVSEGGLVATLAAERHPDLFDGALAACGPVGSFREQLDHFENFRVVFDYFFPGVIPGSVVDVPDSVTAHWEDRYVPAVALALLTHPAAARELIAVTGAPVSNDDLPSIVLTSVGLLWYNVIGSANGQARLEGQPFDNSERVYAGSSDDAALNAGVQRFDADPAALERMEEFETTGSLQVPLVTLHTTGDPIVPVEQESLYATKVAEAGASEKLTQRTVERYGHCDFQSGEVLSAFSALIDRVAPPAATAISSTSF